MLTTPTVIRASPCSLRRGARRRLQRPGITARSSSTPRTSSTELASGHRWTRGRITLLSASLTAVIALVGCSQPEPIASIAASEAPSPTPTSGPFSAPAPTSQEEAVAAGAQAYNFYLQTQAEVYANPSDSTRISEIAIDPVATNIHAFAADMAEDGITADFSGTTFALDSDRSWATDLAGADGSVTDFGQTYLFGCLNASSRVATLADGTLDSAPKPNVFLITVTLDSDASSGRWFVSSEVAETGAPVPC